MTYLRAVDVPFQRQWDKDSRLPLPDPGTAPGNCGPTAVEQVAEYYVGAADKPDYGIFRTRRLGNSNLKLSTTVQEQKNMLVKRGVPCSIKRPTVAELHKIVASGRPVIIGVDMHKVPRSIRGHDFGDDLKRTAFHAITLRDEDPGIFDVADGNFNQTNRPDPTNGHRRYPDWVLQNAYWNAGRTAIVPTYPKKPIPAPAPTPSPTPPSSNTQADGDPFPMRFRDFEGERTVRTGKPLRKGATVSSGSYRGAHAGERFFFLGRIEKADLPLSEREYGDVFFTKLYHVNGYHLAYVKAVDLF